MCQPTDRQGQVLELSTGSLVGQDPGVSGYGGPGVSFRSWSSWWPQPGPSVITYRECPEWCLPAPVSSGKNEFPKTSVVVSVLPRMVLPHACLGADQQVGLTQALFKFLFLPWILECVRFCVHSLRVKSLFPSKPNVLGVSSSLMQDP